MAINCQDFAAEPLPWKRSKFTTKQQIKVNIVITSLSSKLFKKPEKIQNNLPRFRRLMKKTNILRVSFIILNICKLLMQKLKQAVYFTITNRFPYNKPLILLTEPKGPRSLRTVHCHDLQPNKFTLYFNWSSLQTPKASARTIREREK